MSYNPYNDIKNVYDAKVNWNKATTDKERKRQNEIANIARKNLEAYGYADVAKQVSAYGADATAVRKILDSYAPKTHTDTELINKNNNEVNQKVNSLYETQSGDRQTMKNKYTKLEDTAYSNPFTTDEAKAILAKYDLSGLQARNNSVASGGASNGGNIDSYAAANALRQQASLVNQGQMAVLDAHNNKINNVKGILESLGIYQQNQDVGMQNTIKLQQNEGQRLFENDQTAKNNEVARLSEQANVTGYTPSEWVIKNDDVYNTYLNADGTFKKEMENVDIQALIDSAKASGDTATAKKLAVVRAKKILSNYGEFGQYSNQGDISYMSPVQTEAGRQFDKQDATTRESLKTEQAINEANNATNRYISDSTNETNLKITQDTNKTNEEISKDTNETNLEMSKNKTKPSNYTLSDIERMLKNTTTPSQELIDAYNALSSDATTYTVDNPPPITGKNVSDGNDIGLNPSGDNENDVDNEWETFYNSFSKKKSIQTFLTDVVKNVYNKAGTGKYNRDVLEDELKNAILNNTAQYDIDVEDARRILNKFGCDTSWLNDYEDYWKIDAREGMHKK